MNTEPTCHETACETPAELTVSNLLRSTNPEVAARLIAWSSKTPWERIGQLKSHLSGVVSVAERLLSEEQRAVVYEAETQAEDAFCRCGSPIEELFLAALILCGDFCWRSSNPPDVGFWRDQMVTLQQQVPIGAYRVDFLIAGQRAAVVELDGHDFHERTKEQAERDKKRDRVLQATGLAVLRFTGSEVWRDPLGAARSVYEFAGGHT